MVDCAPSRAPASWSYNFDPLPESARGAREVVTRVLADVGLDDLVDTAALLVSELVTNAVVHAGTAICLGLDADEGGVRVTVTDGSDAIPTQRHYGRSSTTGRGMAMVEMLADRHGTATGANGGKTVWFELGSPAGDPPTSVGLSLDGHPTAHAAASISAVLRQVPVPLALAWQQHADALLREYTLAQWDEEADVPRAEADERAAHEAFSVLAAALEPLAQSRTDAAHADVTVDVPPAGIRPFQELEKVLDHLIGLAESGYTLAPPVQPEVRAFRRWTINELDRQVGGEPAASWPGVGTEHRDPVGPPVLWDPTKVVTSADAVIAADDLNRILAASASALSLLGWDEDLLGRRIVTIIPNRFREAHIAAFTLNQLTGENRILNSEVRVPALRRDGSEVEIHLLVRRESGTDGRTVYTAVLRPA